ncbi:hypothetical protein [Roseateles sp.]|uniref:hypothetical protein n=1 Tax=Roseateles sp. TaxID=1971397 RepID=UPI00286B654F|nr:hypothetical protein [Roseateles sp.]
MRVFPPGKTCQAGVPPATPLEALRSIEFGVIFVPTFGAKSAAALLASGHSAARPKNSLSVLAFTAELSQSIGKWEDDVAHVIESGGNPLKLY